MYMTYTAARNLMPNDPFFDKALHSFALTIDSLSADLGGKVAEASYQKTAPARAEVQRDEEYRLLVEMQPISMQR